MKKWKTDLFIVSDKLVKKADYEKNEVNFTVNLDMITGNTSEKELGCFYKDLLKFIDDYKLVPKKGKDDFKFEDKKKDPKPKPPFNDSQLILAKLLAKKIKENNPNAKAPNINAWANTMRLMNERDKRSFEDIKKVILWSQANNFWYKNVLSAGKLREQFDRLFLQMDNEKGFKSNIGGGSTNGKNKQKRKDDYAKYDFS